jgi:hypothetical protein
VKYVLNGDLVAVGLADIALIKPEAFLNLQSMSICVMLLLWFWKVAGIVLSCPEAGLLFLIIASVNLDYAAPSPGVNG